MDKYYVYRPLLDFISITEGTRKRRGYNETLAYGLLTGGNVDLIHMTLDQVDILQGKMLQHPNNKWNSSAAGLYQIVRKTRRAIQEQLKIPGYLKYDADMQDRMACYLLGVRGIDKYLAGRLKEETLINQLAQEWASLPKSDGKGHYAGQNVGGKLDVLRKVLAEVKRRHAEGQPLERVEVPVPVEKPMIPVSVEKEVRSKTNLFAIISSIGSMLAAIGTWIAGLDRETLLIVLGSTALLVVIILLGGEWLIRRIRTLAKELEG